MLFRGPLLSLLYSLIVLLYSMIVLYSMDHKGPLNNITQKPASIFLDDYEAVMVR